MIINLINDTASTIQIDDLHGFTIYADETIDILDRYPIGQIISSQELKTLVTNGSIIINDGTDNLDYINGLKHINIDTKYEAIHNIVDHPDLPTPDNDSIDRILVRSNDTNRWVNYSDLVNNTGSISGINIALGDGNKDYTKASHSHYTIIRSFEYDGTSVWTPTMFSAITSRKGSKGTGYIKLSDYITGNIICELNWENTTKEFIQTESLSNLPINRSVLELQVKTSGGETRIHHVSLY